ncbi:MAG: PAS domain S-box protein [Bacteroidota bacterium]
MPLKLLSSFKGVQKTESNTSYPGKPITEVIINGFFTVNREWTVKYWNRAAEKLLGVKATEIVGKNVWESFAEIIPLEFSAIYHKAFLQDIPAYFEEYWGEMGAWFDVITYYGGDTLSVSFKSNNKPLKPVKQLKALNELYRSVTKITNDCLWERNFQTKDIFWIDGGHKRIFGYPTENALIPASFWESRIHTDDKDRILTRLNKIIAQGTVSLWEDEYRFKRANGEYAYVHDRGHIIYEEGKISRMIGATQDITARKLIEIKLLESEKKLSLIARQTVNAVIITDMEGKITWVNSAFTQISEYEPEEVMGRKPGSFLQGKETDPSIVQYLRQRIKDKKSFDCVIINYSKSGRKYWMHIQGQPLFDEKGNCERFFAIETDISEKVLLENKLAEGILKRHREITDAVLTAQEKERADLGKELHDNLGQILAVAKLYIQMAKTYETDREMYLEKSCEFIGNVIDEIRNISKTLVIPGKHIIGLSDNINNLLHDLVRLQSIKIEFHEDGIAGEDLDEKLQRTIFRIVQEQVNNILKHSKATRATINLSKREEKIILLISDDGKGCDIQKENNGVGIINIKSRAELYHGSVTIASKPGKGFELKVVLALHAA